MTATTPISRLCTVPRHGHPRLACCDGCLVTGKALRFPILTFDEWQFGRVLGGDFNNDWLVPRESLVSLLWKFACANALRGDVLMHVMCPDVDPLEGVILYESHSISLNFADCYDYRERVAHIVARHDAARTVPRGFQVLPAVRGSRLP